MDAADMRGSKLEHNSLTIADVKESKHQTRMELSDFTTTL